MARILLVKTSPAHLHQARTAPPLGLMYLAASLRESGHTPSILDLRTNPLSREETGRRVSSFAPDVVGFSAFSVEMPQVRSLAWYLRDSGVFSGPMILGGPHASAAGPEALCGGLFDVALKGEGDAALPRLVDALATGRSEGLDSIPGLSYRKNGVTVETGRPRLMADVDSLPFPAWDLVDVPSYFSAIRTCFLKNRPYMPVFTSRGCPYGCIYCHNIFGKKFRARSPENVLEEMSALIGRYGIREFEIQDDIFNYDPARAAEICEGILSRGWKVMISFPNGLRCDILDKGLLALMRRAGAYFLAVAVETASERIQAMIHKNLDLKRVEETVRNARDLGIVTIGNFMLGFPTETGEELRRTIDFACRLPLNFASFMTVTPFPGTRLCEMCGQIEAPDESGMHFYRASHNLSTLSDREFFSLRRMAYRRFYARLPQRVVFSGAHKSLALGRAVSHYFQMQLS
ncbi:MAG: B12-binding domain-containing radical SAM protein [Deltaproteobacteria bacterium]|nr:B12-binding domain-containing radical SAM protein [Deltaproteobacteria bacterium]